MENAVSLPPSTTTLRGVWKVAFSIFASSPHLVGSYYDSSQLADFINSKLGIAKVTEEIVKAALVCVCVHLYVLKSARFDSDGPYHTALGRFPSIEVAMEKKEEIMRRASTRSKEISVDEDLLPALQREVTAHLIRAAKRQNNPSATAPSNVCTRRGEEVEQESAEAAKRRRIETEEAALTAEYSKAEEKIRKLEAERRHEVEKLKGLKKQLAELRNEGAPQDDSKSSIFFDDGDADHKFELCFIYRGRVGRIMIDSSSGVVFLEDFEAGLESLPHDQDNENKQAIRDAASYDVDRLGACFCFVPRGAVAKAKAALTLLEESAEIVRKFRRLFHIDSKQHRFSPEAVRYMTAGNLYGYGCSREGMIMI